ncbi:hypothetical protein AVEN_48639-1, partial [Araneus ventricosus]
WVIKGLFNHWVEPTLLDYGMEWNSSTFAPLNLSKLSTAHQREDVSPLTSIYHEPGSHTRRIFDGIALRN